MPAPTIIHDLFRIGGSRVEIIDCTGEPGDYRWHLARPERLPQLLKPENHPQPVWFYPFSA